MSQLSMVALTDYNWYKTLRSRSVTNEVNFWTPTPWNIRRLSKGDIVYFLLKKMGEKYADMGDLLRTKIWISKMPGNNTVRITGQAVSPK